MVWHYTPWLKKVEAINYLTPSNTQKGVLEFIGLLNYYPDMGVWCSHMLEPLTNLTYNKVKFKCRYVEQNLFGDISQIVAYNALLDYPDFNKRFEIHTNSRNFQLVETISQ